MDFYQIEKYPTRERDFESLKAYTYQKLGKKEVPKKNPVLNDDDFKSISMQLDKDNFHITIVKEPLILVNFQTPWCTPCQKLDPVWEELAAYFKNKPDTIRIAKVDCTRNKALCDDEDVRQFIQLLLFISLLYNKYSFYFVCLQLFAD